MSEALTPQLSRGQYRDGYIKNLGEEIANEAYNLQAMETYLAQGESVQDAMNESATLTQGIPLANLKAINALKFRTTVENSTAAVQSLSKSENQFLYAAADQINDMIKSLQQGDKKITAAYFRQIIADIMREATGSMPSYKNYLIAQAGVNDGATDDMKASNQVVDSSKIVNDIYSEGDESEFSDDESDGGEVFGPHAGIRRRTPSMKKQRKLIGYDSDDESVYASSDEESDDDPVVDPMGMDGEVPENRLTVHDYVKKAKRFLGFGIKGGSSFARMGYGPGLGRQSVNYDTQQTYQRTIKGSGVSKNKALAPFGHYAIDLEDLKSNNINLFTIKGNRQRKVPRQAIGGNVANVIKSIVVGRRPKPKDVLSLNDDEREYLAGVGVAAKIDDLKEMPTRKKTAEEKEVHEFEVLKGQIGAGNDNPELVREFKAKLVKLVKAKKVNKNAAHEILLELASMGN